MVVGDSDASAHVTVGKDSLNNGSMFWYNSLGGMELRTRNGGTENSSQLFLAGDGKIGIDTVYPFAKLQIGVPSSTDPNFYTQHPNGLAFGANDTNPSPAIWMGSSDTANATIDYNKTSGALTLETTSTFVNSNQLVLDNNGNIGINSGDSITDSALSVKKSGLSSASKIIDAYYDANNYAQIATTDSGLVAVGDYYGVNSTGGQYGAKASGALYGVYADSDPTIGGALEIGYGVYSTVHRDESGATYWSGFFEDTNNYGNYGGLYADVRSGDGFDLAEYIFDSKNNLEAADIVIADPANKESAIKSSTPYDTSTLGVVSTDPHIIMGMDLIMDEETHKIREDINAIKLALAGRVPMKVTNENGQIKPGDLLTTSSTPGYAMKWTLLDPADAQDFEELKQILAENDRRQNAIIGKAVDSLDTDRGTIVALLSL